VGLSPGFRAIAFAAALSGLAACAGSPPPTTTPVGAPAPAIAAPAAAPATPGCAAPAWAAAAAANAASLTTLAVAPFGRAETGWEVYAPLIQREIATSCSPASEGFGQALAAWQAAHGLGPDGVMTDAVFGAMKAAWQDRRPFVRLAAEGVCPETPDLIAGAEGLDGKVVWLRPQALAAWRRLLAAARAEAPEIAADPELLAIFSGYRSPWVDAARCAAEGNCDGVVRARCSSHRTGLAVDLYLGHAEGYMADATADPNRLYLSRTAAYRWLLANAGRFGFVNYAFEPWHWEWTGEPP
jgi:LAS superfamily LD-carboxypeptidase LdcB